MSAQNKVKNNFNWLERCNVKNDHNARLIILHKTKRQMLYVKH